jgi:LexA DNA binding domain
MTGAPTAPPVDRLGRMTEPDGDPPIYVISVAEYRMRLLAGWIDACLSPANPEAARYSPSVREVRAYLGLSSSSTVVDLLAQMRDLGFVQWEPGRERTLHPLEGPRLGVLPLDRPIGGMRLSTNRIRRAAARGRQGSGSSSTPATRS